MENGELTMNRQVGDSTEEVIITISDDTKILDGVNGYPVGSRYSDGRKSSERLCGTGDDNESAADCERIMIITDVPEDAAFPKYTQVESLDQGKCRRRVRFNNRGWQRIHDHG